MRWLSSAICTSGEPVSPSVVAYSAMIFFLVSVSVPTDMRAPSVLSSARRAGACPPGHSGSAAVARRFSSVRCPHGQPTKGISGVVVSPKRGSIGRMGLLTEDPVPSGFTGTRVGVCNLCEAICGIELTLTDGAVTAIRGNDADPLSRGYICPKGVSMADVYTDPDRLRRPVRRVGEGADARWEELEWDEALDLVADRLAATIEEHGGDAVGVYLGNPNAHSLGFQTHGAPFVRSLRTHNRFSASTVDQIPHQFVAWLLFGHQLL